VDHLSHNDTRRVWQGLQQITNYKSRPNSTALNDGSLAEELNRFFARFETNRTPTTVHVPPPKINTPTFELRHVLRLVYLRKATRPDGIHSKVLQACAVQLAGVFKKIFNISVVQAVVPPWLKSSIIIPVPKKAATEDLNDYRPVALTPLRMKCFEKLVHHHIKDSLPSNLDPHQFANRVNRSTKDAIATTLHTALHHLEYQKS